MDIIGIFSHHTQERSRPAPPSARPATYDALPEDPLKQALRRIGQLEQTVKAGEQQHAQMRRSIERLERQVGILLAARLEGRDDLAAAPHGDHQVLARRFRTLIEQNFLTFARRYASRCDRVLDRPATEQTARLISLLSRQLFTEAQPLPTVQDTIRLLHLPEHDGHIEAAITALREHCADLATRIRHAGLDHAWDFTASSGTPADPTRQDVWAACDARAPVSFIVSPAYLVSGRMYCPQLVFTTR
ncbi:hypothetical protein QQM39_19390 [Streptomyces sp. DT2A-34]|uniref:hypothetical protein n=1 Tax=Streptomyces sp. DT2A-34 TaxID=3051182 RepID=UPI00265C304F|nr:hypothetical protein [Streptomyces sp. DT2A-34]MDO0912931.1 hypothetical protein [Streptomyces sp. DT2A-34]